MSDAEKQKIMDAIHHAPSADTFWTKSRIRGGVDAAEKAQAGTIAARLAEKIGQKGYTLFGMIDTIGNDFSGKADEADELLADHLAAEIANDKNFPRFRSDEMSSSDFLDEAERRVLENLAIYFDRQDSENHRFWSGRIQAFFRKLREETTNQ